MPSFLQARFRTWPHLHQLTEFEEHADDEARALCWTMRSGKSKAQIDKACYLFEAGKIDAVIVIAPNGVHANWNELQFPRHAWEGLPLHKITWRSKIASAKAGNALGVDKSLAWAIQRDTWYRSLNEAKTTKSLVVLAIATETMKRDDVRKVIAKVLKTRRVFLIADESDDFGTPGSIRTKMIRALARRCAYRSILSGTMLTGSPLAAFSQFEILERGALGFQRFDSFKDRYALYEDAYNKSQRRSFKKLIGFINESELREKISRFTSVVTRDETDMPPLEIVPIKIVPTIQQMQVYEDLRKSFLLDLDAGRISVGERAPRFLKLQQVFSGFVNNEYKDRHLIAGNNPRVEATVREAWMAPGKFIVWCEFQADIDFVALALQKTGIAFVEYHGRISDDDKKRNLQRFVNDDKVAGFVGHLQAGGRGLDMSVASTIINHSHTFKARMRAQGIERASAIGGGTVRVVDIIAPGPDEYILKTTSNRVNIADAIVGRGLRDLLAGG